MCYGIDIVYWGNEINPNLPILISGTTWSWTEQGDPSLLTNSHWKSLKRRKDGDIWWQIYQSSCVIDYLSLISKRITKMSKYYMYFQTWVCIKDIYFASVKFPVLFCIFLSFLCRKWHCWKISFKAIFQLCAGVTRNFSFTFKVLISSANEKAALGC